MLLFFCLPESFGANKEFFDVSSDDQTIVCRLIIDKKPVSYITAIYGEEGLYVRLFEVLDQLGYKYYADWQGHVFSGYMDRSGKGYKIKGNTIMFMEGECKHSTGTRWSTDHDLYANKEFLGEIYNANLEFNMSQLAVVVTSSFSAPYKKHSERSRKLEYLHQKKEFANLGQVDTLKRSMAKINAFSYSVQPNVNIGEDTKYGYNLLGAVNGELFRGAFYLGYNQVLPMQKPWHENLRFNWERYDIKSKAVKSIVASHTYANLTSSLTGVSSNITVSNTSDKSNLEKNYTFKGNTTPNAEVEIYNNGNIIDYVTADSLGNFTAYVPITGSENNIKAVSYNEFGVPVELNKLVYVPYGLLDKKKFVYRFSAGVSDYGELYIAPTLEYGVTSWLSVLLGNETIWRLGKKPEYIINDFSSIALLGARFAPNKYLRFDLKYSPMNMVQIIGYGNIGEYLSCNFTYEYFNEGNVLNFTPLQSNYRLNISGILPKAINGNYMLGLNYSKYRGGIDGLFSSYAGFNIWYENFVGNFTVSSNSNDIDFKNMTYTLRAGYYFKKGWYDEASVEYRSGNQESVVVQNRLNYQFKNKLTVFTDCMFQFRYNQFYVMAGVTWRLPFMQIKAGSGISNNNYSGYLNVGGSILFHDSRNIGFSDQLATGASLKVSLYVDANGNGQKDKNEPFLPSPKVKIYTPAAENLLPDGVLYSEIQPNKPFKIFVPQQKFSDISWQLKDYNATIMLSSYQSRTLYIPVEVLTEISGRVYSMVNGQKVGIPDVGLIITKKSTNVVSRANCDDWGEYVHMGLSCGEYTIDVDPKYLESMGLVKKDKNKIHTVVIDPSLEGGQLFDYDFVVEHVK